MDIASDLLTTEEAKQLLARFFRRNGYVRVVDEKRRRQLGQKYKKGYEVRLVAKNGNELAQIRRALAQCGFKLPRPYSKGRQIVQPVYGEKAVDWFMTLKAE